MAKFETHKYRDGRIAHNILGTSWSIFENSDSTNTFFNVHNDDAEINDLFFVDMPEEYKTIELAFEAINEFLGKEDFFEYEIIRARKLIYKYQKANLTYMK